MARKNNFFKNLTIFIGIILIVVGVMMILYKFVPAVNTFITNLFNKINPNTSLVISAKTINKFPYLM